MNEIEISKIYRPEEYCLLTCDVVWKSRDFSDKHIVSIFRIEEYGAKTTPRPKR
jgi:hypothetical protein